uniref:Uncharacterized protein n=1 Tax=Oryza sativa subsp. japonica TaxID=39947 RepID=Q6H8H8_ORYSJ|nr:hypothetical protein [Oryza sativa Japonica Group]
MTGASKTSSWTTGDLLFSLVTRAADLAAWRLGVTGSSCLELTIQTHITKNGLAPNRHRSAWPIVIGPTITPMMKKWKPESPPPVAQGTKGLQDRSTVSTASGAKDLAPMVWLVAPRAQDACEEQAPNTEVPQARSRA